ncbi:hypothetical protein ERJ75_001058100 [Trypanosoma vivax]|uniref:Uncharacterized protein n=1 Tax=Trypanosoma vivax (strain Y486) TaxID=1055687 RepID=G0U0H7_TRYVY|nr:hypothetical protein ERJ75_001058100 [Trypanosoma vivax]CCC49575.1 hypothetical protein TVY486_0801840 [Trypanosoma vivax Y486]
MGCACNNAEGIAVVTRIAEKIAQRLRESEALHYKVCFGALESVQAARLCNATLAGLSSLKRAGGQSLDLRLE